MNIVLSIGLLVLGGFIYVWYGNTCYSRPRRWLQGLSALGVSSVGGYGIASILEPVVVGSPHLTAQLSDHLLSLLVGVLIGLICSIAAPAYVMQWWQDRKDWVS